jgi:hypothetical protein
VTIEHGPSDDWRVSPVREIDGASTGETTHAVVRRMFSNRCISQFNIANDLDMQWNQSRHTQLLRSWLERGINSEVVRKDPQESSAWNGWHASSHGGASNAALTFRSR